MEGIVSTGLYIAYGLLAVCALMVVLFPVLYFFKQDPRKLIKPAVTVGALFLLFVLSYILSADDAHSCNCSKWVGGGLILAYIMLACSILGIAYSAFARYLNK